MRPRSIPFVRLANGAELLAALGCLAIFYILFAFQEQIVRIYLDGCILDGNAISGVSHEVAYQIMGRAQLCCLGGFALLGGSLLLRARRTSSGPLARVAKAILSRPVLFPLLLVAMVTTGLIMSRAGVVEGRSYMGLDDDAMISLRYARNFAEGKGLTYNAGERVEGYTNFFWVVLFSVPFFLGMAERIVPFVVILGNFALVGASVWFVMAALQKLRCPTWARVVAALAIIFDCNTVYFSASGLETAFLACLVSATLYAMAMQRTAAPFLILSFLPLVRSDGLLIAVILAATAGLNLKNRGLTPRWWPVVLALPFAHVVFRKAYYGEWFPNTYFLKMLALQDRLHVGLGAYGFRIPYFYALWALLGVMALAIRPARLLTFGCLLAVFTQALYAIWVGGDSFWFTRFLAPTLPLLYAHGARALGAIRIGNQQSSRGLQLALGAVAFCITPVQTACGRLGMQVPIGVWTQRTVLSAKWLEANAPADTMITVYPAGSVPYYAPQHRFLDVLGKNDRHIGHLPTYASLAIGHNRFDFDYVYNVRKPDIAFPDRGCGDFEAPRYMREAERTQLRNHEAIRSPAWDFDRTHPTFMEMYSRNAVHFLDASPELLGCFFVREGSNVPLFWSRDGRYPRVSSFRYDFGSPKLVGPAAMAGRWHVTRANAEDPGHALSAGDADGEGILDVWFDTTKPLVVNGCLGESRGSDASLVEPGDQPLVVNETDEVSPETAVAIASCAGSHVRWRIPREALEKRTTGTRLRFPAGLSVIWLEGASE